jgi:hypothetical protein
MSSYQNRLRTIGLGRSEMNLLRSVENVLHGDPSLLNRSNFFWRKARTILQSSLGRDPTPAEFDQYFRFLLDCHKYASRPGTILVPARPPVMLVGAGHKCCKEDFSHISQRQGKSQGTEECNLKRLIKDMSKEKNNPLRPPPKKGRGRPKKGTGIKLI